MNDYVTDTLPPECTKFVDDINEILYHADYEVSAIMVNGELDLDATYCGSLDKKCMPDLYLKFEVAYDDKHWCAVPTLSFPDLTCGEDDYYDTMHYWLSNWEAIGRVMSSLNKYWFDPEEYLADLADEEEE